MRRRRSPGCVLPYPGGKSAFRSTSGDTRAGLSSPTPEPAVQDAPPPAESSVGYPVQESDQGVRGSHLVQETSGLRLLRGYDQSRCQQQTNDFQVNGVSSLGENDQVIQQSCTMQEMRLWKKETARQVSLDLKKCFFH